MAAQRLRLPIFDGNDRSFELWEVKFLGYMRLRGLADIFQNATDEPDESNNADAFAELIQCLDDKSLSLVIRDARDDGKKALKILQDHYLPKGKPRIITLYTELTSLRYNSSHESITDFIVRAETLTSQLRDCQEIISDSLLIAMIMKALPESYKPFVTVINQKEETLKFIDFKVLLRNFEDNEKMCHDQSSSVMHVTKNMNNTTKTKWCSYCRSNSHSLDECYRRTRTDVHQQNTRYCTFCRSNTHNTKVCRHKNRQHQQHQSVKTFTHHNPPDSDSDSNHFAFSADHYPESSQPGEYLMDSGATVHIVNNKDAFTTFSSSSSTENHVIQLADGTKATNVVLGQGDAVIPLRDQNGHYQQLTLKNALYVPSFKQSIISVPTATKAGATVAFSDSSGHEERRFLYFELQDKLYSPVAYYFARILGEIPFHLLYIFFYCIPLYTIAGLKLDMYSMTMFFIIVSASVFTSRCMAMMAASLMPTFQIAGVFAQILFSLLLMSAGFFINLKNIIPELSWMSDINYIRWSFQALCEVEINDLHFDCNSSLVPSACPATGHQALEQYGLDLGGLGMAAVGLGGSVLVFLAITAVGMMFIPQKPQDE